MRHSSYHYSVLSDVKHSNCLSRKAPIINPARVTLILERVRRGFVRTSMPVLFLYFVLLSAVGISTQFSTPPTPGPEIPVSDLNWSSVHLENGLLLDEWPHTPIDDCISCLFADWIDHDPGMCSSGCPFSAVNAVAGDHFNASQLEIRLQDVLMLLTARRPHAVQVSVIREGTSGEGRLPVTSYKPAFNAMIMKMSVVFKCIISQAALVAYKDFLCLAFLLHDQRLLYSAKWWRYWKATLSADVGHKCCPNRKACEVQCTFICKPSTRNIAAIAYFMRYRHQEVSKLLSGLLVKFPSLQLRRGMRCARKVHGRLVVSFIIQRAFVIRMRFMTSSSCISFLSHTLHVCKNLAQTAFVKRYVFLHHLLLLAGDVEVNPGPIQVDHELVLDEFRKQFLEVVDAKAVVMELLYQEIIPESTQEEISSCSCPKQRNEILHLALKKQCTKEALLQACDIFITAKGHPNMKDLAERMKKRLNKASIDVLKNFRQRFIADMVAKAVVMDLLSEGIIPETAKTKIVHSENPNLTLYSCLLAVCSNELLMKACRIISATRGHPKMKILGEAMQTGLESAERGGGREQRKSFFNQLKDFYAMMKTVEDEGLPEDQSMSFVSLAFAPFKQGIQRSQRVPVTEGVCSMSNVQTDLMEILALVKEHKLVVISGAPGVGKSTLARKLCQDVCDSATCSYILVLLVELRDLANFKSNFDFVDILQLHHFKMRLGNTSMAEISKEIIAHQGKNVLFILDGFDELPTHLRQSGFLKKLLSHNRESPLTECDVVVTTRSSEIDGIYRLMKNSRSQVKLCNVEVRGFTEDKIKVYAERYFNDESRLTSYIEKLTSIPQIRGLCSIPVTLSIICEVLSWKDDLPLTLTQIYNDCICVKVVKYSNDPQFELHSVLEVPRSHDLYSLAECAFNCSTTQKVVIDSSEIHSHAELFSNRERHFGLLTARPIRSDPKSKRRGIEYFFIHLTVRDFLAAVFVSFQNVVEQRKIWDTHLYKAHMKQVWFFFCGLTKLERFVFSESDIKLHPKEFQMECLFESQNVVAIGKLMPRIVGEMVTVKTHTAYSSTSYGYCLSQLSALKQLTIETSADCTELYRLLKPVYTSKTLQSLTLFQPKGSNWRELEIAMDHLIYEEKSAYAGDSPKDDTLMKRCHFGKVYLEKPSVSAAVKTLCLQHVEKTVFVAMQGCKALDLEVLTEMEMALSRNKAMLVLSLSDGDNVTLPKQFCRSLLLGIKRNKSLSEVHLKLEPVNWESLDDECTEIQASVQLIALRGGVPVYVLANVLTWCRQVKEMRCPSICFPHKEIDQEVVMKMEKAISTNVTMELLQLGDDGASIVPSKAFCRHLLLGISRNTSLSSVDLKFEPCHWDCPHDITVSAEQQRCIPFVTLRHIPVDVLLNLLVQPWLYHISELKCLYIAQKDGLGGMALKLTEMEQTLAKMAKVEKLTLGFLMTSVQTSESLLMKFAVSVLKGISRNKHIKVFHLCVYVESKVLLQKVLAHLTDEENCRFRVGQFTDSDDVTLPCIKLSPRRPSQQMEASASETSHQHGNPAFDQHHPSAQSRSSRLRLKVKNVTAEKSHQQGYSTPAREHPSSQNHSGYPHVSQEHTNSTHCHEQHHSSHQRPARPSQLPLQCKTSISESLLQHPVSTPGRRLPSLQRHSGPSYLPVDVKSCTSEASPQCGVSAAGPDQCNPSPYSHSGPCSPPFEQEPGSPHASHQFDGSSLGQLRHSLPKHARPSELPVEVILSASEASPQQQGNPVPGQHHPSPQSHADPAKPPTEAETGQASHEHGDSTQDSAEPKTEAETGQASHEHDTSTQRQTYVTLHQIDPHLCHLPIGQHTLIRSQQCEHVFDFSANSPKDNLGPSTFHVPQTIQVHLQQITLNRVPVNVLADLLTFFSEMELQELKIPGIRPPQRQLEVRERNSLLNQMEKTLAEMNRLKKMVIGTLYLQESQMLSFGKSVLEGISRNKHISALVLYDKDKRKEKLQVLLAGLSPDKQKMFTTTKYTDELVDKLPCITWIHK